MSLFKFDQVPVKTRLVYAVLSSGFTTLLCYIIFTVFEMADYDWGYYVFFFVAMFIFGFFSSGYSINKKKK